jgi:iron complex transport system substrate-binding protein
MGGVARATALAAVALLLAAGASACGERSEPTGPGVRLYPVTVADAEDRNVTLDSAPRRVVALTDATAQIVRALGAGAMLVAPPARFFDATGKLVPRTLRTARPQLVLAAPETDGLETGGARIPAPVFIAPNGSLEEVERAITRIGLLLGRPVQARRIVHGIEAKRGAIARALAGTRPVTVFFDGGFFTTAPEQSLVGDLLRQAKGRNVAGASAEHVPFDLAQLAQLNPAVYLTTSDSGTTLRDLRMDPRTRKLRAVRQGRFATIDTELLEPGPRVGQGLVAIARALHPDAVR